MDAFEWATLFLYLVAWWVPIIIGMYVSAMSMFSEETGKRSMRKRYKEFKTFLPKLIPGWAFGPIWSILYTMIAFSSWVYLNYSDTEMSDSYEGYFDAVNALMLVNYMLNMSWTSIFFGFSLYWLGTLVGFFVFITALAIEVLMWIHSGLSATTVVGAVIYIPYVVYSGYAFILAFDVSLTMSISNRDETQRAASKDEKNNPDVETATARTYRRMESRYEGRGVPLKGRSGERPNRSHARVPQRHGRPSRIARVQEEPF